MKNITPIELIQVSALLFGENIRHQPKISDLFAEAHDLILESRKWLKVQRASKKNRFRSQR